MTTSDLSRYQDPLTIQRVLLSAKTIAVVGLSGNAMRASHFVGFYLQRHGYRVIPGQSAGVRNPRRAMLCQSARGAGKGGYRQCIPCPGRTAGNCRAGGRDRGGLSLDSVQRDQRGGCANRRTSGSRGGHGSVHQGRTRPLRGPNALARLQYGPDHIGTRRSAVAARNGGKGATSSDRFHAVPLFDVRGCGRSHVIQQPASRVGLTTAGSDAAGENSDVLDRRWQRPDDRDA